MGIVRSFYFGRRKDVGHFGVFDEEHGGSLSRDRGFNHPILAILI